MKRFILFTFSLLLTFTIAIAQDGINYQGAATDANGDELTNQNITLRASVLSATANGNLEWEETHSATTDQFGLFNVVIGQGTNTTNGATASFDDMDWGSGNHFLKIEMDATGGTNYAMIGTTQMMSVPYALYAKSAGIDSAMLANMIGSSGGGIGGDCNLKFPDGLDGEIINIQQTNNYQVPLGKRLYVTHTVSPFSIDGIIIYGAHNSGHGFRNISNPIIVEENQVLASPIGGNIALNGILINTNQDLFPITIDYNNYQVPASKKLIVNYVRRGTGSFGYGNTSLELAQKLFMPIIINQGTLIQTNNGSFNGYLVDENYFAGCGGGGGSSSSASAVDSAMVAGMIANAGGGGSFGDFISINTAIETQATSDGFLYGKFHLTNVSTIEIFCDTFSGNTSSRGYFASNPYGGNYLRDGSFNIPIRKNEYYSFNNTGNSSIYDAYFVPLESGGGGSSNSGSTGLDSATVATMIANAIPNGHIIGQMLYWNGGAWDSIPAGAPGTILQMSNNGVPAWSNTYLSVGDNWEGGTIAYLFEPGDPGYIAGENHGYVVHPQNNSDFPQNIGAMGWGCDGIITGINNSNLGEGYNNTALIASQCPTGNGGVWTNTISHAKFWNDLNDGGFDDWFMPNSSEASKLDISVLPTSSFYISEESTTLNPAVNAKLASTSTQGGITILVYDYNSKSAGNLSIGIRQF